jgi:hypothetical protein
MATLLRVIAVAASLLVVLGFAAFASDQASEASKTQVQALGQELDDPAPQPATERERERRHGSVREVIDDANDVLLAPFAGLVDAHNAWVRRLVPTVLALLVYGLLLALVANFLPRPARPARDWRQA